MMVCASLKVMANLDAYLFFIVTLLVEFRVLFTLWHVYRDILEMMIVLVLHKHSKTYPMTESLLQLLCGHALLIIIRV